MDREYRKPNLRTRLPTHVRRDHSASFMRNLRRNTGSMVASDVEQLINELQVSHSALEIENKQLRSNQAHLRQLIAHYHQLYDEAPVGYMLSDTSGVIVEANRHLARILGREQWQLLHCSFASLLSPEDAQHYEQHLATALQSLTTQTCNLQITLASGEVRELQLETIVRPIQNNYRVLSLVRDCTEQGRATLEQMALREQYHEQLRLESLAVLAGGIAHDLNNWLLVIAGNAELANETLNDPVVAQTYLSLTLEAVQDTSHVLQQVLLFAGRGRLELGKYELNQLVCEAISLFEVTLTKQMTIKFEQQPHPICVTADAHQIRQVLLNLVLNAADAIGDDDGCISLSVGSVDLQPEDLARCRVNDTAIPGRFGFIRVSDTGCGISDSTLQRIFDPYFSTKPRGNGLGLVMARAIMRMHKGAIAVESKEGKGTTFTLYFPINDTPDDKELQDRC